MVQTIPAVNKPSKNIPKYPIANNSALILPNTAERKKPTHVDVHSGQLINSPKNLDFLPIHSL